MTYRIEHHAGGRIEPIAPYLSDILVQLGRLVRRFPDGCTLDALFAEYLLGRRALWLVIAEDGKLAAVAMTHLRTVDATGAKVATLSDLAGSNVSDFAEDLCAAMEAWARDNGATVRQIEGRPGWAKLLARYGYRPHAVTYRKVR